MEEEQRKEEEEEKKNAVIDPETLLRIKIDMIDPNELDFKTTYQDNLPPQTHKAIGEFYENSDKDTNKEREIAFLQKKARDNLQKARDLLPEEGRDYIKIC